MWDFDFDTLEQNILLDCRNDAVPQGSPTGRLVRHFADRMELIDFSLSTLTPVELVRVHDELLPVIEWRRHRSRAIRNRDRTEP